MMKIFICPSCGALRVVSRRANVECLKCEKKQMMMCNLEFGQYSGMTEEERIDYAKGWLYIHERQKV